jgi:pilus assembly protein CpaC
LPIIGALFRSQRFQNRETELVVFVTPSLAITPSGGTDRRVDRALQRLQSDTNAKDADHAPTP